MIGVEGRPVVSAGLRELRRVVSYRRFLLDAHLAWASPLMRGVVVDLGGKRDRRRGQFKPTDDEGTRWIFVNLDPTSAPDLLCDVTAVPLPDATADCVLCTEVLEHLPDPAACVGEARRLLRPGGRFIASVPFMYPVHPDPRDFHRFAPDGLRRLFEPFPQVDLMQMGGDLGTIASLIDIGARRLRSARVYGPLLHRVLFEAARFLQWVEVRRGDVDDPQSSGLTTGYFLVATK